MARKFLTALDLAKNELQNGVIQNLASAPSSPVKGQLYFNSTDNTLYWWDGSSWVPAKASGGAFPGYGAVTPQTTFGAASADGAATTVARSDHTHGTPVHGAAQHNTISLSTFSAPLTTLDMNGHKIANVGAPTAGGDATNKTYVDGLVNGTSWKTACRLATTANITLSGAQSIDGVAVVTGDRILVKNQSTGGENGIYSANTAGAWTRTGDMDAGTEFPNAATFISEGSTLADTTWVCTTNAPITIGTTATVWAQFGAGASYVAGAGLVLNGNTFDLVAGNASLVVQSDTVAVGYAGSGLQYGSAFTAARSDHDHRNVYTPVGFAADCAAATSTVVTHNFQTQDVQVIVYDKTTPYAEVECDVEHTSTIAVTVRFAVAPTAAQYRIVVWPRT